MRTSQRPQSASFAESAVVRERRCASCGRTGVGVPYFRRAGHIVALVALALFSYGVAGLVFWIARRDDRICPSCGTSWDGSRTVAEQVGRSNREAEVAVSADPSREPRYISLPDGGGVRRIVGIILGLGGLYLIALGATGSGAVVAVTGLFTVASGVAAFLWGRRAERVRRQRLMEALQLRVLESAIEHRGRVTATDVARDLGLTLPASEHLLFSMDDGLRVRSDVTDEGLLVFDFREIRLAPAPTAPEA